MREAIRRAPGDIQHRLSLTGYYLSERRAYDALDSAQEAHALFPTDLPLAVALGEALRATGRHTEAVAALRGLPDKTPEVKIALARHLVRDGRREEAAKLLDSLSALRPEEALQAGQLYLDALAPERAVKVLGNAPIGQSADLTHRTTTGVAHLTSGNYQEAVRVLTPTLSQASQIPILHFYLGSALRLSGDLKRLAEAAQYLQRATELEPTEPLFHYELALARVQLREWEPAREAMERCVALKSDLPEAQRDLARIYLRLQPPRPREAAAAQARYLLAVQDPAQAVARLKPHYAATPADKGVATTYAFALHESGKSAQAVAVLARLRDSEPSDESIRWELLRAQRAAGDAKGALKTLGTLPSKNDTESLHEEADLLQRLDRQREAEEILTSLCDREPENAVRHFELGLFSTLWSKKIDRDQLAEKSFLRALELRPEYVGPHYRLGLLYERTRRPKEAILHLRRAHELSPDLWEALRPLGRAYARQGDKKRADECFALYRRAQARSEDRRRLELVSSTGRATRDSRQKLIQFLLSSGDLTSATRELEAFHHSYPEDRETQRRLVQLYGFERRFQRQFELRAAKSSVRTPKR
ncbi:MAG: tetratricopeptide repeat protein [Actinomycetota bacterium]